MIRRVWSSIQVHPFGFWNIEAWRILIEKLLPRLKTALAREQATNQVHGGHKRIGNAYIPGCNQIFRKLAKICCIQDEVLCMVAGWHARYPELVRQDGRILQHIQKLKPDALHNNRVRGQKVGKVVAKVARAVPERVKVLALAFLELKD